MKSLEVWKKTFMMIFSSFLIFSLAAACSSKDEEPETECEANQEKNDEGECVDKEEVGNEETTATAEGDDWVVSSDATKKAADTTDVEYTVKVGAKDAKEYTLSVSEGKVTFADAASEAVKDDLKAEFTAVAPGATYEGKVVFAANDKTAELGGADLHAYAVAVGVDAADIKKAFGDDATAADEADLAAAFDTIVGGLEQKEAEDAADE